LAKYSIRVAPRPLVGLPSVRAATSQSTTSQLEDTRSDHETA